MMQYVHRYYTFVALAATALCALFAALGTGELVAGVLESALPEPVAPPPRVTAPAARKSTPSFQSGQIIIDRNIFDSTVVDEPAPEPESAPPVQEGNTPLVRCTLSGVRFLAAVAAPTSPDWSFADLEINGTKQLVRIGDTVSGRTVSDISWRHIILRGTSDECYIDLFDQNPTASRSAAKAPRVTGPSPKKNASSENIEVLSEYERTVDRSLVDQALANPTKFAQAVRVRPYKKNGEIVGFRLRRVQRGSAIEKLGAKRGDVLHAVNGIALRSVDDALKAYQSLRNENQLVFSITRKGKPVDLKINIR